jgi:precorrin-6B C5,15-methyltransferase / cobalt-precorrin-6B C5,C15-methyltransferase
VDPADAAAAVLLCAAVAAISLAQDASLMSGVIVVVGIGADGMAGLTEASRLELHRAAVIYGSPRQLRLLDSTVGAARREWPSPLLPALQHLLDDLPQDRARHQADVHVLASGDPLLHGIGSTLIRLFGTERVTVLPHVSAVTLACARMGWTVHDTEVISLVNAVAHTAVRRGGRAIVLSRDAGTPAEVAGLLADLGRGDSPFSVLEQLGGPGERCRHSTARNWAAAAPDDVDDLNVIAVHYLPDEQIAAPLAEEAFSHDGQITKQGIRAVTLAALAPRPGARLWDVGSGSGSIAVEWARSAPGCISVAFERDETRRARIARNAAAFGVNVEIRGAAPAAFDGAATPSAVFIGGGLTQPGMLDACFTSLPSGGLLVANAVTAESEVLLVQAYSRLGGKLQRFQHYQGELLGGLTGWRPRLPVTQWAVTKP